VGLSLWVFLEYDARSGVIFGQPAPKRRLNTAYLRCTTFQEIDDVKQKVNAASRGRLTVGFEKEEFWCKKSSGVRRVLV
jgi:hypothetical protein